MHQIFIVAAAAALQQSPSATEGESLVVTASREPVQEDEAAVSTTLIEQEELESLALPFASDALRLVPGVSIAASGGRGSLTEVRIRGAEAKHSLLFVDGIKFNDPAQSNVARFELLTNDPLSRIEVVRGPQSALWGSEALGGVIALETADPLTASGVSVLGEYGSLDSLRTSVSAAARSGRVGIAGSVGWIRTDGIDIQGPSGERDGFDSRTATLKTSFEVTPTLQAGLVGHWVEGDSEYDGSDPVTFGPSEDVATENRIGAVRGWVRATPGAWQISADASLVDSSNRNFFADAPVNRTWADRLALGAQVSRRFGGHRFTVAAEHETEDFHARDQSYFGATDQDRSRDLTAIVVEWRADWSDIVSTGVALRHDSFSAFEDATTFRANAAVRPVERLTLHAGYGEGLAQPTFYDLYGFYPELGFRGNPDLRPESSRGWEAGLRWGDSKASLGITGFTQNLVDENLLVFDSAGSTTVNATGESRRRGVEIDTAYAPSDRVHLQANYTYLDAEEQRVAEGLAVREARRPRHSANVVATARFGGFEIGSSLAYVGARGDTDFSTFPSLPVTLDEYVLASVKLGWRVGRRMEAYARLENAFDADYQDAAGYNTPGRTAYAGIRLRFGD